MNGLVHALASHLLVPKADGHIQLGAVGRDLDKVERDLAVLLLEELPK